MQLTITRQHVGHRRNW